MRSNDARSIPPSIAETVSSGAALPSGRSNVFLLPLRRVSSIVRPSCSITARMPSDP